jgi:hypothetical protein
MARGKVDVEMSVDVDVEDFAASMAWCSSDDQAKFFEEFFIQLEMACDDRPGGLDAHLDCIVAHMGLQSLDVLRRMAEAAKKSEEQTDANSPRPSREGAPDHG